MKLSLTAIAALFAATLHPSVATGTRAASSTGNTNADEAKPNRDLGWLEDMGLADNPLDKFDGAFDAIVGELVENKLAVGQSKALAKLALVQKLSGCLLTMLGQNLGNYWAIDSGHLGGLLGKDGIGVEWFQHLAGTDEMIGATELNKALFLWPSSNLHSFLVVIAPICSI